MNKAISAMISPFFTRPYSLCYLLIYSFYVSFPSLPYLPIIGENRWQNIFLSSLSVLYSISWRLVGCSREGREDRLVPFSHWKIEFGFILMHSFSVTNNIDKGGGQMLYSFHRNPDQVKSMESAVWTPPPPPLRLPNTHKCLSTCRQNLKNCLRAPCTGF